MKQKKWLIGLIAPGLVLVACGSGGSKTVSNEAATQKINVAFGGEFSTLDSAYYTDVYSSDMIDQIVEGLYRQDKNGDPELAMAKVESQASEDGLVYTLKLREAKWTDGDPAKAGDFVVALRSVVDPAYGSSSNNQMDIFKNGCAMRKGQTTMEELGVKAIDDQTLELTLENSIPYLTQVLVGTLFMPKNEAFTKEKGTAYGTSADNFAGNGPFVISGWDDNSETWKLKKNDHYWDKEHVKLNEVDVQAVKEIGTRANLFDNGDLDYTVLIDTYAFQYKESKQAHFVPKAMVGYLNPNHRREITGNEHVRKAFLQAIDKETFAKEILGDGSTALNGFVSANFTKNPDTGEDFRKENGDLLPYNIKEAQTNWNKAKGELGKDKIELELVLAGSAIAKKTIEFVQGRLQQNLPGLAIKLKSLPLQNRLDLQAAGNCDLAFGTWTPDYADPFNFLEFYDSKSGLNTSGYNDSAHDTGLQEVRKDYANEPEKRWNELLSLEKTLIERGAGVLPLFQGTIGYLESDRLQGLQVFSFGRTVSYRLAYVEE